ncbi:phosphotransferase [Metabacillus hrfriensis]|uniref:Phosphotransferase n=1 Tax=Metabacillus hrfriensis TaxID=3048891 RepID=A0ACD4R6H9_9BACI|nr:phosphotransferase [Metabacillus sp. CT-WN-B3]WHZ56083.1 phosphotransferase [Metabacillus sp. CT-WN-B3]
MNSDIAKQAVFNYLQEDAISVNSIVGKGIVNKIYVVRTANHKVVIRMNDDPSSFREYEKERWCILKAIYKGIPSPEVLTIGKIGNIAYMIQTHIEGVNGVDATLDKTYIWRKLGMYAKSIHTIEVKGFGEVLFDAEKKIFQAPTHDNFDGTWTSFVNYNITSLTKDDDLIWLGVLDYETSKQVKRRFQGLIDYDFNFGLNHGDLSLKNTVVNKNNEVYLLDWGSSEVNIAPHWDVIQLMQVNILNTNTNEFEAFLDGYGISQHDFKSMEYVLNTLLLLRAFDKLRWAIDCKPQSITYFTNYAKLILHRVL